MRQIVVTAAIYLLAIFMAAGILATVAWVALVLAFDGWHNRRQRAFDAHVDEVLAAVNERVPTAAELEAMWRQPTARGPL